VHQRGSGFCHLGTRTCFGEDSGLAGLARLIAGRVKAAPEGSYTKELIDNPGLLRTKLVEEARELADAGTRHQVVAEAADVMYFTLVALGRSGVDLAQVEAELDRRARRVTRGPAPSGSGDEAGR